MEIIINSSKITGIFGFKDKFLENILINNKPVYNYKFKYISEEKFLTKRVRDEFYLIQNELKEDNYINKIISSLNIVGLSKKYLERDINTLSKSEKKLLMLSLALATNPNVIILKNIFNDLDKKNFFILKKIIVELNTKYHKTIILVDDNIEVLYEMCSYFVILKDDDLLINDNKINAFKDLEFYYMNKISLPFVLEFAYKANRYNKKIPQYYNINDLIKEVYRRVNEIER